MNENMLRIHPNLWFDGKAEEAANFYTSLFENSKIGAVSRYGKAGKEIHGFDEGTVLTVEFELAGQKFSALNGGANFKFTPAISFFVTCESEAEVDRLWQGLSEAGKQLMPLKKYDWSEKYGWIQDQFGLSWQISLGKISDTGQKIVPCLLFTDQKQGMANSAVEHYTSTFNPSTIDGILKYGPDEEGLEGTVKHAQFKLLDNTFMVMDSPQKDDFDFNESISFVISCETQKDVDYYWEKLIGKGGEESMCGWLKDPFGVSWQVVPKVLTKMMTDKSSEKVTNVMNAFMKMKKFDIAKLEEAYYQQD